MPIILFRIGLGFAQSVPEENISFRKVLNDLTCEQLINYKEAEKDKFDYSCITDSDCVLKWEIGVCGACVNKDVDANALRDISEVYSVGIEKGCLSQVDCLQSDCSCKENKCQKENIKQ